MSNGWRCCRNFRCTASVIQQWNGFPPICQTDNNVWKWTALQPLYYQSTKGIPQGTIVGPMLFLNFVNYAPLYVQNWRVNIYAHDATLVSSSRWDNTSPMNNNIQKDLESIQRWAIMNKMIINEKKTKSMLIRGKRLRKCMEKQHLAQNSSVEKVSYSQHFTNWENPFT